ncbi:MAG: hypothetical protein L0Z62_04515 [Gemmataceae bacterium]|nr:hypothetical protein [Gemmataceae bacterium]
MRGSGMLCGLLILGGLLGGVRPVRADEGSIRPPAVGHDPFLSELLAILNETRSPDAFLVTISILQEMKPEARLVVPAIIRNAERLKLFAHTKPEEATEEQRTIADCIAALMKKEPAAIDQDGGALTGGAIGAATGALSGAGVATPTDDPLFQQGPPEALRPIPLSDCDPLLGCDSIHGKVKSNPGENVSPGRVKPRTIVAD